MKSRFIARSMRVGGKGDDADFCGGDWVIAAYTCKPYSNFSDPPFFILEPRPSILMSFKALFKVFRPVKTELSHTLVP